VQSYITDARYTLSKTTQFNLNCPSSYTAVIQCPVLHDPLSVPSPSHHTEYRYCILLLHISTAYCYCISLLHISTAYLYCILLLHTATAYLYCILLLHISTAYRFTCLSSQYYPTYPCSPLAIILLSHHNITTLLPYYITVSLHHYINALLHHYITASLHYYITASLHYYITALLHHSHHNTASLLWSLL
jgi:hypothetical protein